MTRNGIGTEAQDNIVQGISSFAMYGFPESHAASFALIAYASAYLKVHYLAAFTCGLLNNQPMGFYSPAVLIKDAQRHGLRVRPIDVQGSSWLCSLEDASEMENVKDVKGTGFSPHINSANESLALAHDGCFSAPSNETQPNPSLRIGLNYVKGLRQTSAEALLAERSSHGPFASVDQLAARVPQLNRKELVALASVGALNPLGHVEHRRDALWQVEQAGRPVGPLLRASAPLQADVPNPLRKMTADERLAADYAGTGITIGSHPMAWQRTALHRQGFLSARELEDGRSEAYVKIAGRIICRQRPGTAKGFVFLSLEDETGIANIIVTPDVFEQNRLILTRSRFLSIAGRLQNQEGVVHVKAQQMEPFTMQMDQAKGDLGRMWR
jgi:error-prone DNA polymerase